VLLMKTPDEVTGPFNIGNPEEISVYQLACIIKDLTGSSSRLVHRPSPEDDPRKRRPDISKFHGAVAWSPTTPLRAGLMSTISFFDGLLSDQQLRKSIAEGVSA
jgi:UDP-glucuronate decarboxylase